MRIRMEIFLLYGSNFMVGDVFDRFLGSFFMLFFGGCVASIFISFIFFFREFLLCCWFRILEESVVFLFWLGFIFFLELWCFLLGLFILFILWFFIEDFDILFNICVVFLFRLFFFWLFLLCCIVVFWFRCLFYKYKNKVILRIFF